MPTRSSAEYAPLTSYPDDDRVDSLDDEHSQQSLLGRSNAGKSLGTPHSGFLWGILLAAFLSALNAAMLPFTLTAYSNIDPSRAALDKLPYPSTRLGLDRAAKMLQMSPPPAYHFAWPDKIARVNQKIKNAVYGDDVQVFISVEDSTFMRFPIPPHGTNACSLTFSQPIAGQLNGRGKDLETRGDISEIEVWSIIAPSRLSPAPGVGSINFDELSWNTRPVRGELLGTLDLRARPNATSEEFACPSDSDVLMVEFRCLRVDCHVKFMQVNEMLPKLGFQLVRRHE